MAKLQVFDPPMCCPTGACGPNPNPALVRFEEDLDWLRGQGIQVQRYNLAEQQDVFNANEQVKSSLDENGNNCLPLILVEGQIVSRGEYPTRETLAGFTGITNRQSECASGAKIAASGAQITEKLATYRDAIYRYTLTIVRDSAEADDLTQDTLLRAQSKVATIEDPAKLEPWLYRIATNICYDRFRQASYRHRGKSLDQKVENAEDSGKTDTPIDTAPRLDKVMEQKEMSACVQKYVTDLTDSHRAVIMLHDMQGLTNLEIAAMLDISLATVKIRLHRARKQLRAVLEGACLFSIDERGVCICEPKPRNNKE